MNVNIHELTKKVPAKGVLHVGANTCQELDLYKSLGFENRLWIEGNKTIADKTRESTKESILCAYVGQYETIVKVHQSSNNSESTSILRPLKHTEVYPQIEFKIECDLVKTFTLDRLIRLVDYSLLNYLVLDIQGSELDALKGLGMFENHFEIIITEAYIQELYFNCGKLHEIEAYLTNYKLVEFKEESGKGWGDAAFIRKDLL